MKNQQENHFWNIVLFTRFNLVIIMAALKPEYLQYSTVLHIFIYNENLESKIRIQERLHLVVSRMKMLCKQKTGDGIKLPPRISIFNF